MNLLILFEDDFIAPDTVRVSGQRLQHLLSVKNCVVHDRLELGLLNGQMGIGIVRAVKQQYIELEVLLDKEPPAPLPVHLLLALPRPKMLKRILQTISAMGVKQLTLIHSAKVEKSFWQSPWLQTEKLQQNLLLGLAQAKDTMLPEVNCYQRFKPFIEDVLPGLIAASQAIVAHPGQGAICPGEMLKQQHITLAVGPEGGFTDYEIEKFQQAGFQPCHLGERILRVENAIPVLLGRLMSSLDQY